MKIGVDVSNTNTICGIGIVKEQIYQQKEQKGQKERPFTVYGSLYKILTTDNIKKLCDNGSAGVETLSKKNTILSPYSEFMGVLCNTVLNLGLNALKIMSNNKDISLACEYIIKLMKYCRLGFDEFSNFEMDNLVQGVLATLPLNRSKARDVYAFCRPEKWTDLPTRVEFNCEARKNIGYILYSMCTARGIEYKKNERTYRTLCELNISESDIENYSEAYKKDTESNRTQIQSIVEVFESVDYEKLDINPMYIKHVLQDLSDSYPENGSPLGKHALAGANSLLEFYLERNIDSACNIFAESYQFISEAYKGNKDNLKEQYIKNCSDKYGSDIKNYGDKIFNGAADYDKIIKG